MVVDFHLPVLRVLSCLRYGINNSRGSKRASGLPTIGASAHQLGSSQQPADWIVNHALQTPNRGARTSLFLVRVGCSDRICGGLL